jgi:hypothetical protein
MHPIEQKINLFLEAACDGKASFSEDLIQEFGERCKAILRESFVEREKTERKFYLRMSNIGRPLRQLMLDKVNGSTFTPNKEFKLKATVGHIYEAFMFALLKMSGVNVNDTDKQVTLDLGYTKIPGTYDVKIDGKIYDVKTASPYAYEFKFNSLESLRNGDAFGYFAQGFGYSLADKSPFGGWLVINKATGEFRVLPIPDEQHNELSAAYNKEIHEKAKHVLTTDIIPPCVGVEEETFFKKKTGNKVLNRDCEWCNHKQTCHPNLTMLPDVNSKAKVAKMRYYVGEVKRPEDKA